MTAVYQDQRASGNAVYNDQRYELPAGSTTQGADTLVATAEVLVAGTLSYTLMAVLLSATGDSEAGAVVSVTQAPNTLSASAKVLMAATVTISQGANSLTATAAGAQRYVEMSFRRGNGQLPQATAFKFAFWDQAVPDLLTAPAQTGTGNIDANGYAYISLPSSTLPVGGTGYILLSDTDGNAANPWKHHSGPIVVS